jgi:formate-dependent nitrite reductase membrane component NrfD
VKLPVLLIAALALAFLGLDGILLIIAQALERATPERASKVRTSGAITFLIASSLIRDLARPRVEKAPAQNPSVKEKFHEHACTG